MERVKRDRRSKYETAREEKKKKREEEKRAKKEALLQAKEEEITNALIDRSIDSEDIQPIDESESEGGSFVER